MRPLAPVLGALADWDFVGYRERQGHVANNFIGAPRGSVTAAAYYARVCALLRAGGRLGWLTIGAQALTQVVDARPAPAPWLELDRHLVQPIDWSEPGRFFEPADAAAVDPRALCYMLSAHTAIQYAARHPGADLMREGSFFRLLIDRSLGASASDRERRG
jgi:hypothetical protein